MTSPDPSYSSGSVDQLTGAVDARPARRQLEPVSCAGPTTSSDTSSLACGACAGRISLREFVLIGGRRVTRAADCPECGQTTVISLA